jgi:hypothetical protein
MSSSSTPYETYQTSTTSSSSSSLNDTTTAIVSLCYNELPLTATVIKQLVSFEYAVCLPSDGSTSTSLALRTMTDVERLLQSTLSQHFLTCNQTSTAASSSSSSSSFLVNAVSSAPPDVLRNCSTSPITNSVRIVNASTGSSTNLTSSGWQQCCTIQSAFTTELYYYHQARRQQQPQPLEQPDRESTMEDTVRQLANATSTSFSSSGADTTISNPAVASVFGSFLSTLFTTSTSPFLAAQTDMLQLHFLGFTNGAVSPGGFGSNSGGIDSTSITPSSGSNGQPASAAALVGPQAAVPTRPDGRFIVASLGIGLTVIASMTLVVLVGRLRKRGRERPQPHERRATPEKGHHNADLDLYAPDEEKRNEPDEEDEDGSITVLSDLKQLEWQRQHEQSLAMAHGDQHDHNNNYNNHNDDDEEYPHDEEPLEREESSASSRAGNLARFGFWKVV